MHTPATTTFARRRGALRRDAGITQIEALIALLVLSLGMLALAQVQSMLRYNTDVAKQRSEAVRIAQANMESLRAFGRLTATTGFKSYAEVAASGPTQVTGITTNTTFSVTNAVTEVTSPQYKALTVSVSWTDRNGTAQSVSVNSLISRTDPSLASQLAIPPEGSPVRNPFDRNVRIPITAKTASAPGAKMAVNFDAGNSERRRLEEIIENQAVGKQKIRLAILVQIIAIQIPILPVEIKTEVFHLPDGA